MDGRAPLLAGIDVGTTNTKVGVYDATGAVLAAESRATSDDPRRLVGHVCAGLQRCIDAAGRPPDAVGITSMAETGVALDAGLAPLHDLLRWDDPLGAAEADLLDREIGAGTLWRSSGIKLAAKAPLARWVWLRNERLALWGRMRVWAGVADLITLGLGAGLRTDPTLAARTGAFDVVAGRWSAPILQHVGLRPRQLPPIDPVGRSGAVAGLRSGTPVVIAGHDHLVAAYAAGMREAGQSADSMGTAEAVVTVTERPPADRYAGNGASWNRTADGRHFCLVSGFPGSGRLMDWYGNRFAGDMAVFERLAGSAACVPTGIVVEPYLAGRAAPEPDVERRVRISGLTEEHGAADLALAVIEGACLQARWITEDQAAVAESAVERMHVFGGPTRNPVWMRTKAAVMPAGISVVRISDLAAAGAALLGGTRSGVLAQAPAVPANEMNSTPELATAYSKMYHTEFLPRARSGK